VKTRTRMILLISGFVSACTIAAPGSLHGQAPPGPIRPPGGQSQPPQEAPAQPQVEKKQPPPRKTIFGAWRLNRDESDDARKKMEQARGSNGGSGGNGPYGGGGGRRGGVGFPFPGGGGGGGPYGGHGGGGGSRPSDQDQGQFQSLLRPASSFTLVQKDAEVDLVDDLARKRVFYTDGRKLQKSKDESYQEIAARWDGSRLISDEKTPRGAKLSRSFELAQGGQQLYEILHLDSGRSSSPVSIRYVYDIAEEDKQ
jgi:hypothetical protein